MQRAACLRVSGSGSGLTNSFQLAAADLGLVVGPVAALDFEKPGGLSHGGTRRASCPSPSR